MLLKRKVVTRGAEGYEDEVEVEVKVSEIILQGLTTLGQDTER